MFIPEIINISSNIYKINEKEFYNLLDSKKDHNSFSCLISGGKNDSADNCYFAYNPFLKFFLKNNSLLLETCEKTFEYKNYNPWDALNQFFNKYKLLKKKNIGAIGYFSYECGRLIEKLPQVENNENIFDIVVLFFSKFFHYSKHTEILTQYNIITNIKPFEKKNYYKLDAKTLCKVENINLSVNYDSYINQIKKIIHYIKEGDIYQANLSQKFTVTGEFHGFNLFKKLFKINPAPFFAYLNLSSYEIISTSPERFIKVDESHIETRPIKGTIERGINLKFDEINKKKLYNSSKDSAELAMIVDLLRNDIGKCSMGGSVEVVDFKRIEQYHNVFHLIGIVTGELENNKSYIDLIRAAFPGGSITGCPKIRAMEIISELENETRGIYTGTIFFHSFGNYFDSNIAIRTILIKDDKLYFRIGGGIVYDSIPEKEYAETIHKGRTILEALGIDYNQYLL